MAAEIPVVPYDDAMPEPTYGTVRVRILDGPVDGGIYGPLIRVAARRRNMLGPDVEAWWVPAEDVQREGGR